MIKELWNVGLKVTDLDREVAFLREVGASLVLRERVSMVGEERDQDSAGPTRPLIAALLRTEEVQVLAQKVQEGGPHVYLPLHLAAINIPAHSGLHLVEEIRHVHRGAPKQA